MKKRLLKTIGIAAAATLSLSLFAACGKTTSQTQTFDSGVVKAFHAVVPEGDFISRTAATDGAKYRVTVITPLSVSEYSVNSEFKVESTDEIVGGAPALSALALEEGGTELSDLERAYAKALELSGIDKADVEGFDFDRDTYMGQPVFKVEIEDAAAEYSYIFSAADLTLLGSKTELKQPAAGGGESSYIGEERAKEIALSAAQAGADSVEGLTVKSVMENGRRLYKVEFAYQGYRYAVEIDAIGGNIVKYSESVLGGDVSYPEIPEIITEEQAKEIALAFAFPDGAPEGVQFRKVKLDYEKGRFVYEVEFVAGGKEYELEIASDGEILDVEIDEESTYTPPQSGEFITRERAIEIVRDQVGADAFILDVEIEVRSNGGEKRYYYEIEVKVNGTELEFYVDAVTGEIAPNDGYTGNPAAPTPSVSEESALQIALDSFGLTKDQITSQRIKLEREDGRLCYEVKLFVGSCEYKMSIDAHSGEIIEKEIDREHGEELPPQTSTDQYISREQAVEAVKAYFRQNGKEDVRIGDVEWEDEGTGAGKRFYYEVEVSYGSREYECYVDALTGEVRVKGELVDSGKPLIGEEKALSIALEYFTLTKAEVRVSKVKLEEDDGILIYEVEFKVRDLEYTVEIDAMTGDILESDVSFD